MKDLFVAVRHSSFGITQWHNDSKAFDSKTLADAYVEKQNEREERMVEKGFRPWSVKWVEVNR